MILLIIIPTTIYQYVLPAWNCANFYIYLAYATCFEPHNAMQAKEMGLGGVEQRSSQQSRLSASQIIRSLIPAAVGHLHHRSNCLIRHGPFLQFLFALSVQSCILSFKQLIGWGPRWVYIIKINLDYSYPYILLKYL